MKFNASLLRERFSIENTPADEGQKKLLITALSTRMAFTLQSGSLPPEPFVVRSHNMHTCARAVGKLVFEYDKRGPLLTRQVSLNWSELWDDCLGHYERAYAESPWICVYHKGKPVFKEGTHHPFLDVVEKCDTVNKGDYDSSIILAKEAFRQAGADVRITHDSSIALVADLSKSTSRCGMILRNADRTNNFNVNIQETATSGKMNISLGLTVGAAFLEAVQLGFTVGLIQAKLKRGLVEKYSAEDKNAREARNRISRLEAEISACENMYTVRYRPERPNFLETIMISERTALRQKATS